MRFEATVNEQEGKRAIAFDFLENDRIRFAKNDVRDDFVTITFVEPVKDTDGMGVRVYRGVQFRRLPDASYSTSDRRVIEREFVAHAVVFSAPKEIGVYFANRNLYSSISRSGLPRILEHILHTTELRRIASRIDDISHVYLGNDVCEEVFLDELPTMIDALEALPLDRVIPVVNLPILTHDRLQTIVDKVSTLLRTGRISVLVLNDWGAFSALSPTARQYGARTVLGRWVAKVRKDPRYPFDDPIYRSTPDEIEFNVPRYRSFLHRLGVSRIESDLPSNGLPVDHTLDVPIQVTVHVPYQYVNYTRSCMIANFFRENRKKMKVGAVCHRQCANYEANVVYRDVRDRQRDFSSIDNHLPTLVRGRATIAQNKFWTWGVHSSQHGFDRVVYTPSLPF